MSLPFMKHLEENFDAEKQHVWFAHNWWLSCAFSAIYFVGVFAGRAWMENRPKFDLRGALTIWSGCLAIFSIIGAVITIGDLVDYVTRTGWHGSICDATIFDGRIGLWTWLFIMSKAPELGDTLFIVLRKQKLIFLHWYHHITVLIYSWYSYRDQIAPARYFIVANFTVHAVMYSYYALRASGVVKIPRQVNISITLMQLIQMVIGCVVNIYALLQLNSGTRCDTTYQNVAWSLAMYFSYFVLFAQFFYKTYLTPSPKKDTSKYRYSNEMNGNHQVKMD
ncbi:elongation of very long chain fatty acids protein 6-like [Lytechinus variegatus]|uniref:elongation of very long chain fatty acids protein 6-like n=1 Tax=Lytechinus variegatus TaxID=7654 RepID=UPI001BB1FB41|nr:elongation of very long chain fatty acids protein 6-like [Lytechinus variegatus]